MTTKTKPTIDLASRQTFRSTIDHEANARLIAAAPDLLEALRMWLHLHEAAAGYEGKYGKELDAAIAAQQIKIDAAANASRAAIAKATGDKA